LTPMQGRHVMAEPELGAVLQLARHHAELIYHAAHQWTSASFTGDWHTIQLRFAGVEPVARAEEFIQQIPDHDWSIAGKIVAEASIVQVERFAATQCFEPVTTVVLQLLTVEE
jgi:hypothetical protein